MPLRIITDADVWVESAAVAEYELPYRPSAVAPAVAFVRHKSHVTLGRVESSDPGLSAETLGDSGEVLRVACRPTDPDRPVGEAVLRVYAADGSRAVVEVPVSWRPTPRLRCVPATTLLDPAELPAGRVERRVDLFFRNGTPEFTAAAKVPWVAVRVERTPARSSVWLTFDRAAMPETFDGPLAGAMVPGGPSEYGIGGRVGPIH